jgi:hypothetical protein
VAFGGPLEPRARAEFGVLGDDTQPPIWAARLIRNLGVKFRYVGMKTAKDALTTEEKVVEILTSNGRGIPDDGIHAVNREMGWYNAAKSREFVRDLEDRGLVHWACEAEARNGARLDELHILGEWKRA